jgi:hypothetical protein
LNSYKGNYYNRSNGIDSFFACGPSSHSPVLHPDDDVNESVASHLWLATSTLSFQLNDSMVLSLDGAKMQR